MVCQGRVDDFLYCCFIIKTNKFLFTAFLCSKCSVTRWMKKHAASYITSLTWYENIRYNKYHDLFKRKWRLWARLTSLNAKLAPLGICCTSDSAGGKWLSLALYEKHRLYRLGGKRAQVGPRIDITLKNRRESPSRRVKREGGNKITILKRDNGASITALVGSCLFCLLCRWAMAWLPRVLETTAFNHASFFLGITNSPGSTAAIIMRCCLVLLCAWLVTFWPAMADQVVLRIPVFWRPGSVSP